jgi:hypothetical protein
MEMEMAVISMEMAETAMETDGDDTGGTAPSRPGARTETSVPRNSSAAAAELRNSFWKFADCFRVFRPEASYRRRGVVRSGSGPPHHRWARPGPRPRPLMVRLPSDPPPLRLSFGPRPSSGKNRSFGCRFVQFREYFLCSFSKTQKQQKTGNWHCSILSIG